MAGSFGSLVFTPLVKALQEKYGSRRQYARMEADGAKSGRLTPDEVEFIAERDSFYMATVGSTGWPYVQHRGGPVGFLKALDDQTVAFADFRGNKQYITTGNLGSDNRVALIMVDYPRRARLKILGRAQVMEGDAGREWMERLREPGSKDIAERAYVIHVEAFDWNCPQHITPRFTEEQIREALQSFERRMEELEQENRKLRAGRILVKQHSIQKEIRDATDGINRDIAPGLSCHGGAFRGSFGAHTGAAFRKGGRHCADPDRRRCTGKDQHANGTAQYIGFGGVRRQHRGVDGP